MTDFGIKVCYTPFAGYALDGISLGLWAHKMNDLGIKGCYSPFVGRALHGISLGFWPRKIPTQMDTLVRLQVLYFSCRV